MLRRYDLYHLMCRSYLPAKVAKTKTLEIVPTAKHSAPQRLEALKLVSPNQDCGPVASIPKKALRPIIKNLDLEEQWLQASSTLSIKKEQAVPIGLT